MVADDVGTLCKLQVGQRVYEVKAVSPDLNSFHSQVQLGSWCSLAQGHAEIQHSLSGGWKTVHKTHNHHESDVKKKDWKGNTTNVFFTLYHTGYCCTNVICGYCYATVFQI